MVHHEKKKNMRRSISSTNHPIAYTHAQIGIETLHINTKNQKKMHLDGFFDEQCNQNMKNGANPQLFNYKFLLQLIDK